jgi:hypothetical protein
MQPSRLSYHITSYLGKSYIYYFDIQVISDLDARFWSVLASHLLCNVRGTAQGSIETRHWVAALLSTVPLIPLSLANISANPH